MQQQFQSSFIPKGSIGEVQTQKKKVSLLGVLAFLLFILSIASSVGVYFYKNSLNGEIESLKVELANAGQNIDKETISNLISFSKKLESTRNILVKHSVVSQFLSSLSSSTVSSVYFTDFSYEDLEGGNLKVNLKGRANSYSSIALQERVFSKNKYWSDLNFSNLRLGEDGAVDFSVSVNIDREISVYSPDLPASAPISVSTSSPSSSMVENDADISDLNLDDIDFNF